VCIYVCVRQNFDAVRLHCSCRINSRHKRSTLSDSPEPLKCCVLKPHHSLSPLCFCVPVCVVLVAYSENNASPGDRSDALHVLILYYLIQREPPHPPPRPGPSASYLSCRHLHFAYAMHCQLQDPQYGLLQLVFVLEISFWEPSVFLRFVELCF